MSTTPTITQIFEDELVGTPTPHTLATGKNVFVFNLKISPKSTNLKTGQMVGFQDQMYEVMNSYVVTARTDYLKFTLMPKSVLEKA